MIKKKTVPPHVRVWESEILQNELSPLARLVYIFLKLRRGPQNESWWSNRAIAEAFGRDPRSIERVMRALVRAGAIAREGRDGRSSITTTKGLRPTPDKNVTPPPTKMSPRNREREIEKERRHSRGHDRPAQGRAAALSLPGRARRARLPQAGGAPRAVRGVEIQPSDAMSLGEVMKRLGEAVPGLASLTSLTGS